MEWLRKLWLGKKYRHRIRLDYDGLTPKGLYCVVCGGNPDGQGHSLLCSFHPSSAIKRPKYYYPPGRYIAIPKSGGTLYRWMEYKK